MGLGFLLMIRANFRGIVFVDFVDLVFFFVYGLFW